MRINAVQQQINIKDNKQPQFKGVDVFLRFLATNQGIGANLTDLSFMVAPRVITDAKRGPEACAETARREMSGTVNHSCIGLYGAGAGALATLLLGVNRKYNANANTMFTAPETLNILAQNKANQIKNKKSQLDYIKETLSNIKAYNPTSMNADKEGFVRISKETINDVAKLLDKSISKEDIVYDVWKKQSSSDSLHVVMNKIIESTGAESKYVLESADKKIVSETGLKTLLEDLFKVSKSFNKEKVVEAFNEQVKKGKTVKENAYIRKFSQFMKTRAFAGFAIATGIGMSIQPINMYITKLKTGSDGFVGVEGRSKDNSTGFKILKGVAGAGFFGLVLASLKTGIKGFMDKMAFKGFMPTISQLKGIYGLTIISRLLVARDKDELRESLTKDSLGFLSWLVLGDIVNRLTAETMDSSVMNRTKDVANKGFWKRAFNSTLKTRDEILIETLAQNGISTVKKDGDKQIAKKFSEMVKDLDKLPENVRNIAKKRLSNLNKAQLVGYAFTGFVLGLGIPNLNIYITNKLDKKRKAKLAEQNAQQPQLVKA